MCAKMHDHEIDIDEDLVGRLLAGQFPQWAALPIKRVESSGTDNAIYRLGDELAVRLPRIEEATGQAEWELRWLPWLAPQLPLAIPAPLVLGQPAEGYPWTWAVYRWLAGETARLDGIVDHRRAATALGEFVTALHAVDTAGGPAPATSGRGAPLVLRDADVREAIAALAELAIVDPDSAVDVAAATAAWEAALQAPQWQGPPTWIHGDLHAGNLLMHQSRLSAVIDFAGLSVGDPACDCMVAWTFLSAPSRDAFRAALAVDDATWARGGGWALCVGLVALPYYRDTNPVFAAIARHAIDEVLADPGRTA